MNTNKIKQIFQILAKKVTESFDSEISGQGTPYGRIYSLPMIRGGMALTEGASEAYIEALDDITAIAEVDGTWSRSTVDDVLWEHVQSVIQVSPEARAVAIRSEGNEVVRRFSEPPSQFIVDLLVYGMDASCADLKFGRLTFFSEEVSVDNELRSVLAEFPGGNQMFARLETTAIDKQSAIHRAGSILDEHVMILNALCSQGAPSLIRVSRVNHMSRTYAVSGLENLLVPWVQ